MSRFISVLLPSALLTLPAYTLEGASTARLDAETVLVLAGLSEENSDTGEPFLGEVSLRGRAEHIFDTGLRLRLHSALRVQRDNAARPGAVGGFDFPGVPETASLPGAFSGLAARPPADDDGFRINLETAYLQIDGGYGELRLGKDQGVAPRFHEGGQSVLSHARLDTSLLDPSGLSIVRTRNDITGQSVKLSYATPRLLGLRLGASFTPKTDDDGLDRRPGYSPDGRQILDIENSVELALNAARKLPGDLPRLELSANWSQADVSNALTQDSATQTVETYGGGLRVEWDSFSLGGSFLESDDTLSGGPYAAWSAGAGLKAGGLDWSLNYGSAEDEGRAVKSQSVRLGGARNLGEDASIAIAYTFDELESERSATTRQGSGIVIEITRQFKLAAFD